MLCIISLYHSQNARPSLTWEKLCQVCFKLLLSGKRSIYGKQASAAFGWDLLSVRPILDDTAFALLFVPPSAADWRPCFLTRVNDMSTLELVQFWETHYAR